MWGLCRVRVCVCLCLVELVVIVPFCFKGVTSDGCCSSRTVHAQAEGEAQMVRGDDMLRSSGVSAKVSGSTAFGERPHLLQRPDLAAQEAAQTTKSRIAFKVAHQPVLSTDTLPHTVATTTAVLGTTKPARPQLPGSRLSTVSPFRRTLQGPHQLHMSSRGSRRPTGCQPRLTSRQP